MEVRLLGTPKLLTRISNSSTLMIKHEKE